MNRGIALLATLTLATPAVAQAAGPASMLQNPGTPAAIVAGAKACLGSTVDPVVTPKTAIAAPNIILVIANSADQSAKKGN